MIVFVYFRIRRFKITKEEVIEVFCNRLPNVVIYKDKEYRINKLSRTKGDSPDEWVGIFPLSYIDPTIYVNPDELKFKKGYLND